MTPERWREVDRLLNAALEVEAAKRADFLAAACGGDEELRREVESLLGFQARASHFIEAPPAEVAADWLEANESRCGEMIGRYQLERELGRGGMGVVYLATDTRLGRQAALKLLPDQLTRDLARVRRFHQEARAASALNHPNILTIYEVGRAAPERGSGHFIAAELVSGRTVREICRSGGLRLGAALDLLIQVASALEAAHRAGIIHRDIKPENIMLRRDGIVKVLDFGLAKLTEEAARPEGPTGLGFAHLTTEPGMVMGTTSYMSPEQARGLRVDSRSDLFSLGVVMYELLTGHQPFTGETSSDVLVALLSLDPRPLSGSELPPLLQEIIGRALAKPVEQRYQTAREIGDSLKGLKEELEFSAKMEGRAGTSADLLMMIVGRDGAEVEETTYSRRELAPTTAFSHAYQTSRPAPALLPGRLRRQGPALAAAALLALAALLGFRLYASRTEGRPAINRIAVLPFANESGDARMDHLPDAMTESMIDNLSQISGLTVMASSTVFAYKGDGTDPRQAGKVLRVDSVVTGELSRQGDQFIFQVEMLRTSDGARLWGGIYPVPPAGILPLQKTIRREIAGRLKLSSDDDQDEQVSRRHSQNSDAYRLYMIGHSLWKKRTSEATHRAIQAFRDAIEMDQNYALAYVGLADAYSTLGSYRFIPALEAARRAREAAEQALRLDGRLAEAHASLGKILSDYSWDWASAEREFKLAISIQPNYANAHHWYSALLVNMGRPEEAIREAQRARELDFLSPATNTQVGSVLYRARRYDQAIEALQEALNLEPNFMAAHLYLAMCHLMQRRYDEALESCRKGREIAPNATDPVTVCGMIYGLAGRRDEALRSLAELKERSRRGYVPPSNFLAIYAVLGETDRAFEWLEKCFDEGSPSIRGLKTDPMYDPLRSDARFGALLERAGLTP